jgi:hypothetical protein
MKSYGRTFYDDLVAGASNNKTTIPRDGGNVVVAGSYVEEGETYYKVSSDFQVGDILSVFVAPPNFNSVEFHVYDENDNLMLSFMTNASWIKLTTGWFRITL